MLTKVPSLQDVAAFALHPCHALAAWARVGIFMISAWGTRPPIGLEHGRHLAAVKLVLANGSPTDLRP